MLPNEAEIHPDLAENAIATNQESTTSSARHGESAIPENLTLGCIFNVPGLSCSESQIFINQESIIEDYKYRF